MTEKRAHRGPHPKDAKFFSARAQLTLREATGDLCWLLSRDYALHSASELVGNRYELSRRQRMAVGRCACSRQSLESRRQREIQPADLAGEEPEIGERARTNWGALAADFFVQDS